jgi:3-hydroxybutyryl-CoA dehydratase
MHDSFVRERPYEQIELGESFSVTKGISEADIANFGGVVGDFNPIHFDPQYAKTTMFGQRLAHGMMTASFISTAIGCGLPGKGALYLGQDIKFVKPVYIGDTVTARVEVIEKQDAKRQLILKTTVTNQHGDLVVDGKATVRVLKKES